MIEPLKNIDETLLHLGYMVTLLGETYDFQYDKGTDLTNLGEAIDAMMHAVSKLDEQKKIQLKAEKIRLAQLTAKE